MSSEDRCLICGDVIPEGMQVCTACMNKYNIKATEAAGMVAELQDVADILNITEGTDGNIRKSMQAILNIADRLERKNNGAKRG